MTMSKFLVLAGIALIAVGVIWFFAERLGLGRLPGDIVIERENFRLYIPIATSILISILLTLILWFINRP